MAPWVLQHASTTVLELEIVVFHNYQRCAIKLFNQHQIIAHHSSGWASTISWLIYIAVLICVYA
jgi:hypothetical protein